MKPLVHSDEAFHIMTEITQNESISQRELSQKLGISLGAVNALINKMIADGLVKIEKIPPKRVLYMLTPVGMVEKAKKTVNYLKYHYEVIRDSLSKLETLIIQHGIGYDCIYVLINGSDFDDLLKNAVTQVQRDHGYLRVIPISSLQDIKEQETSNSKKLLLYFSPEEIAIKMDWVKCINLVEYFN